MEAQLIGLCYEHVSYILMAYRWCAVALCWTQHIYYLYNMMNDFNLVARFKGFRTENVIVTSGSKKKSSSDCSILDGKHKSHQNNNVQPLTVARIMSKTGVQ